MVLCGGGSVGVVQAAVDSDGGKLMPPITPGWDPRPREFIDLPWGDQGRVACVEALGHTCYVQDPTLDELSNHTKDAVKFALEHPRTVEVQAVIMYVAAVDLQRCQPPVCMLSAPRVHAMVTGSAFHPAPRCSKYILYVCI